MFEGFYNLFKLPVPAYYAYRVVMALVWNGDKGVKFMLDHLTVTCYLNEPSALRLLVGLNGAEAAEDRLDLGDGLQFRLLRFHPRPGHYDIAQEYHQQGADDIAESPARVSHGP